MKPSYYDGTKLLSKLDINGKRPEIYMCCSNRTGGKTTYFSRMLVNRFLSKGLKFMLLYRFQTEMENVASLFFDDIAGLFFHGHEMKSQPMAKGKYHILTLDERDCGYAVALNSADYVKRCSHLFSDTNSMFMDEFQPETNVYAPKEVSKLISIHTSVARGQGKQVRYVPVYMCSNSVTLLNPYFVEMGISTRLNRNTNFLKGDGFVLEQNRNESAAQAQKESAFNRAFANSQYTAYASENVYLNDNFSFIQKMPGNGRYLCTIKYKNAIYSIKEYQREGIMYVDTSYDLSYPQKLTLTTDDHSVNYIMIDNNRDMILKFRWLFSKGCFRFRDLNCKEMLFTMLSY